MRLITHDHISEIAQVVPMETFGFASGNNRIVFLPLTHPLVRLAFRSLSQVFNRKRESKEGDKDGAKGS